MVTFDWDLKKAASNLTKHGISFEEACTAFWDPLAQSRPDPDHSEGESRFLLVGATHPGRLLVISFLELGGIIRLISARDATRAERRGYEEA